MESSKETGCQASECPILCINNCSFFGSAATMNMYSKCHKDMVLKQQDAKLAASSIENIVNGSSSSSQQKEPIFTNTTKVEGGSIELKVSSPQPPVDMEVEEKLQTKAKKGPNRCNMCRKRVGLTGFSCRCGNLFCSVHHYSDKHECSFDYQTAGQDAIVKANPLVIAEKLYKI